MVIGVNNLEVQQSPRKDVISLAFLFRALHQYYSFIRAQPGGGLTSAPAPAHSLGQLIPRARPRNRKCLMLFWPLPAKATHALGASRPNESQIPGFATQSRKAIRDVVAAGDFEATHARHFHGAGEEGVEEVCDVVEVAVDGVDV